MKKVLLFIILSLSIFMLAGCGSEEESTKEKKAEKENTSTEVKKTKKDKAPKEIEKIDSCPDCVFFYNEDVHKTPYFAGEERQKITDYTDDYTSFKTSEGDKAKTFLGGVLDSEGKLKRAYVCSYKDGYYCLEASTDGSTHKANIEVLNEVFGKENCDVVTKGYDAETYDCRGENTRAASDVTGNVSVGFYSPSHGCYSVSEDGYLNCR